MEILIFVILLEAAVWDEPMSPDTVQGPPHAREECPRIPFLHLSGCQHSLSIYFVSTLTN